MDSGIYALINKVNGKYYIGMSVSLVKRKTTHFWSLKNKRHKNLHLQRAFDKVGEENFVFEILEYCSVEELKEKEIHYINFFDAVTNGYNLTFGGEGTIGYRFTDEQKLKISKANKGRICSPEENIKKSISSKRCWDKIPEIRENHIKRMTGNKYNVGRVLTEERKKTISEQMKGRIITEAAKGKLRERFKGEGSASVKLKEKDVIEIRLRVLNGEKQTEVHKDFPSITVQTINDIHRGRRWKHVPNTIEELEKLKETF